MANESTEDRPAEAVVPLGHDEWQARAFAAEARAAAAEVTAHVLKQKVMALMSGGEKSAIERQLIQVQKRADAMVRRREMSELRATELERYSQKLEQDVAARTRTIRTILDNVAFGFLLIDRALVVQPGYTRSCGELLAQVDDIAGKHFGDAIGLTSLDRELFRIGVEQVFDDFLPEDVALNQLPARTVCRGRILRIEARTVRNDAGAIEQLLLSITDISALEAAERDAQHHRSLVDILRQRDAFRSFVRDARMLLDDAHESADDVFVRRAVHTIKGNAATFGLSDVAALAHEIEERGLDASISKEDLSQLGFALQEYLVANHSVLKVDLNDRAEVGAVLTAEQVRELAVLAADASPRLQAFVGTLGKRRAGALLGPIDRMVARVCGNLGKQVSFRIDGADTAVDPEHQPVFGILGHLVRNALDHGIAVKGNLDIAIVDHPSHLSVVVKDDGRGIDVERVGAMALARGFVTADEWSTMSQAERLRLVFRDGVSTAQRATQVSGRGVGMSAVLKTVEACGGTLEIDTAFERGTAIALQLPKTVVGQCTSVL